MRYIFLTLIGFIGFCTILVATITFGPGITHDSVAYIYASKSFLHGRGFEYFGYPGPFIQWPPLFPMLLAAIGLANIGPVEASRYLNAIFYGLIIFFSGYWLFANLKNKFVKVIGTLIILFSVPLIEVSKYVWTESLFILLLLMFFLKFEDYIYRQKFSSLIIAAVFSAMALLDRYIGVILVLTGLMFLLIQKKSFSKKIFDMTIFGVISSFPIFVWIIRNYIVSSTFVGLRLPSTYTLKEIIQFTITSIFSWIQPEHELNDIFPVIMLQLLKFLAALPAMILAVFLVVIIYKCLKNRKYKYMYFELGDRIFPIAFFLVFSITYIIFLMSSATATAFDPINRRLISPVYLPMVFVMLIAVDFLFNNLSKNNLHRGFNYFAKIIAIFFLVYQILNAVVVFWSSVEYGAGGYSDVNWQNNKLIGYLNEKYGSDGCSYYSNYPDVVYDLTGIHGYFPPKRTGHEMYGFNQFEQSIKRDRCSYIIWFNNWTSIALYNIEDIGKHFKIQIVEQNSDGTIYRFVS